MDAAQFDAIARSLATKPSRRGVARGVLLVAAGVWAVRHGIDSAAAQDFWPCPDGVDGHRRDCMCECRRFLGDSAAACQAACLACNGHISPVCFDVDERGDPTNTPVCCADRKPCRLICGDSPDGEPLPDLA